jgi:dipeptidyl-peptidase-4
LADISFVQNSYPDENHGIGSVKKFLYRAFDAYWTRCFGLDSVLDK